MKPFRPERPMTVIRMEIPEPEPAHRMLYGEETLSSRSPLHKRRDSGQKALKDRGEVYSDGGRNFIFVLPGSDRSTADEVYGQVREACTGGVIAGNRIIPLNVYAGALELPDDYLKDPEPASAPWSILQKKPVCAGLQKRHIFPGGPQCDFREERRSSCSGPCIT